MKRIKDKVIFIFLMMIIAVFVNTASAQLNTEIIAMNSSEGFMAPSWSPDGKTIAFTSAKYRGIWIINPGTKTIKHITDEPAAGYGFRWSGDSKVILSRVAKYENTKRYNAVKIFNIESGESSLLTEYRTMIPSLPVFSSTNEAIVIYGKNKLEIFPSGLESNKEKISSSKTVYIRDDKIAVEDLVTKEFKIIEPLKNERVLNIQLSPDGRKIAFEIIGGDMYAVNIDGTGIINLGKGYRPKWSPDSGYIVYMISDDDGHQITSSDIYTIKADGTNKTNITGTEDKHEMNPDWSPDGSRIAYDLSSEGIICTMQIR